VDIRQIADKFPDKRGGLKEMYDKGPQAAFFLVKFWVTVTLLLLVNTVFLACSIMCKHGLPLFFNVCCLGAPGFLEPFGD